MIDTREIINGGLGALGVLGTAWGVYMQRKSKQHQKNEEDSIFVENAEKLTGIWEKLSNGFQSELAYLREESKDMLHKYTELKIELEVSKSKSDFVIEQLKLQVERLEAERDRYKKEAEDLRVQLGTGIIRKLP